MVYYFIHMRILFLGLDRQVFVEGSEARERMRRYTALGDEVHLIMFTLRAMSHVETKLADNVFVHPTRSRSRACYIPDAVRLGKTFGHIDLVSSQDPFECAIASILLARHHQASLQVQMHIDPFNPYFKRESLLNRFRPFLARHTLPYADCIRPVSERIKQSVAREGVRVRRTPVVLPVYVDVTRFKTGSATVDLHTRYPQHPHLVLMAGRLVPQKDIPTALRAFQTVHTKLPDAGLVIVGEGPDAQALHAEVARLGLDGCVHFEPWQNDMLSYLKTADVFLMTSTHEGYQRALGEAAAAGAPVVTTDTGPVGSIYRDRDTVLACPVGDAACIAERVTELLTKPVLREELTQRAREVSETAIAPNYDDYLATYRAQLEACARVSRGV